MQYYIDDVLKVLILEWTRNLLDPIFWIGIIIFFALLFLYFGIKWFDFLIQNNFAFPYHQIETLSLHPVNETFTKTEEQLLNIHPSEEEDEGRQKEEIEENVLSSNEFYETDNLVWNFIAMGINCIQLNFIQTIEKNIHEDYSKVDFLERIRLEQRPPFDILFIGLFCFCFLGLVARDIRKSRIKSCILMDLHGMHPRVSSLIHVGVVGTLFFLVNFDRYGGFVVVGIFFIVVQLLTWNAPPTSLLRRHRASLLYSVMNCKIYITALEYLAWLILEQREIRNHTKLLSHLVESLIAFDIDSYIVEGFFSSLKIRRVYIQYCNAELRNLYQGNQVRRIHFFGLVTFFLLCFYFIGLHFRNEIVIWRYELIQKLDQIVTELRRV